MAQLRPTGNLLISLFNGHGDAYLALPVFREIARQFQNRRVYLAGFPSQIDSIFWDLPFTFLRGSQIGPLAEHQVELPPSLLQNLPIEFIATFDDYFPLSSVDKALIDLYPKLPRYGMFSPTGREGMLSSVFRLHIRDQYFKMLGWEARYSPEDRQVSTDSATAKRVHDQIADWSATHGTSFYTLHLDSVPEKMWPVENWVTLVAEMWSRWHAWPLIVGRDVPDVQVITNALPAAFKVPEEESMRLHFAIVRSSPAFIGIDSVFAHAADSFNIPSVVLFSLPTWAPNGWAWLAAPFTDVWGPVGPCATVITPDTDHEMRAIRVQTVIEALALSANIG